MLLALESFKRSEPPASYRAQDLIRQGLFLMEKGTELKIPAHGKFVELKRPGFRGDSDP